MLPTPLPRASLAALPGTGPASVLPAFTYRPYSNGRFGFAVEVPSFFVPSRPPDNDDGQEWKWGSRATLTAAGMYAFEPIAESCERLFKETAGLTYKSSTTTSCVATGSANGKIHWARTALSKGVMFDVWLDYDESLKAAFDPIVEHVSASWKVGLGGLTP